MTTPAASPAANAVHDGIDVVQTRTDAPSAFTSPAIRFHPPPALVAIAHRRLSLLLKLHHVDHQGARSLGQPGLAPLAKAELTRQRRRFHKLPEDLEAIENARLKLLEQKEQLEAAACAAPEERHPAILGDDAGDIPDPDDQARSTDDASASVPDDGLAADNDQPSAQAAPAASDLLNAIELGLTQVNLLRQRRTLENDIIQSGLEAFGHAPLMDLLAEDDDQARAVFGWTAYAAALDRLLNHARGRLDNATKPPPGPTDHPSDEHDASHLEHLVLCMKQERRAIEPRLVHAFWVAYARIARMLVSPAMSADLEPDARMFLRFGFLADLPWLAPRNLAPALRRACERPTREPVRNLDGADVLYADEYVELVARGRITPSIDDDLELNGRATDAWKADKLTRKRLGAGLNVQRLEARRQSLEHEVEALTDAQAELEAQAARLDPKDRAQASTINEKTDQAREAKMRIARLRRAIALITDKRLPAEQQVLDELQAADPTCSAGLTVDQLVARESAGIRRMARLCARLKEPFLPFELRDRYGSTPARLNDREGLLSLLAEHEQADPLIFREVISHAKRPDDRVHLRVPPICVIVPGMGETAFCWNPRSAGEPGRMVFPLVSARPGATGRMMMDLMADFRWDTSKQSAGVDLLNSDTLVAAYATARWNCRKKSREQREKAGFFSDENDRTNWRRHYRLFIESIEDGGKRLQFKSPEVYEAVVRHIGLPPGRQGQP